MDEVRPTLLDRPLRTREAAIAYLLNHINYERSLEIPYGKREFKLDRMQALADRIGNPQDGLRIVHVAGSKGKGSTATMIAAMLTACGYRTGLYTSPHLTDLSERFRIDSLPIPDDDLIALTNRLAIVVAGMDSEANRAGHPWDLITFFELTTALGFLYFAEQRTDFVVLEVGMGGRLDSTNICHPVCSVITSIGLDHTRQLGKTLAAIAGEKAGIIKPGVPVVSGVREEQPQSVIRRVARDQGCPLWELDTNFHVQYRPRPFRGQAQAAMSEIDFSMSVAPPLLPTHQQQTLMMLGEHQAANAAVALATVNILRGNGWNLPPDRIRQGLAAACCPARIQIVATSPVTILDTAHNQSSMRALLAAIDAHFEISRPRRIVIFAATRGKDVQSMLQMILEWSPTVVLTKYLDNPRGVPVDRLRSMASRIDLGDVQTEIHMAPTPRSAWELSQTWRTSESLLCVTGSFFLAAEIQRLLTTADDAPKR